MHPSYPVYTPKIKTLEAESIKSLMSPDLWQYTLTVNYIGFDLRHDYVES